MVIMNLSISLFCLLALIPPAVPLIFTQRPHLPATVVQVRLQLKLSDSAPVLSYMTNPCPSSVLSLPQKIREVVEVVRPLCFSTNQPAKYIAQPRTCVLRYTGRCEQRKHGGRKPDQIMQKAKQRCTVRGIKGPF